jgi:hypothetical protein
VTRDRLAEALLPATVLGLLCYWLLYSLVATVNVDDGQMYNQARLYVIKQGGLLHNNVWHTYTQIMFPWSFDAVHWPFVRLGFGYALPSYACLLGILLITHLVVREAHGRTCGWLCCLTLLALPTLVYQGTSTKNDIPVVFGAYCWFYAMWRYRRQPRVAHLLLAAVAVAFAGGAKSSGLQLGVVLGLATLWRLRRQRVMLLVWLGALLVASGLLLSVETYAASRSVFGAWFGSDRFVDGLRNRDGLSGAMANLIRYVCHNVDPGTDALTGTKSAVTQVMERTCRWLLARLGLADRGLMFALTDANLDFRKLGHEAQAGFGPVGTLGILMTPALLAVGRRSVRWLAAGALCSLLLVSLTTGYHVFNNRFLLLPFSLAALAVTLTLWTRLQRSWTLRVLYAAVLLSGAVLLPAHSFNRKPADLWLWVSERDRMTTREYPSMLPVLEEVRALHRACPPSPWVVTADAFSWEFLFYDLLRDQALITRAYRITGELLAEMQARSPGRPVYVLAVGQTLAGPAGLTPPLATFPDQHRGRGATNIYRFGSEGCEAG